MEIVWLYPILERYFVSIPTEYWALKGGVPDDVLMKTSTWLPSSQTDPPPEITEAGTGFILMLTWSLILFEQLRSATDVKSYIDELLGLTEMESLTFERVTDVGAPLTE